MRDENTNDQIAPETGQNNKTPMIVGAIVVVALIIIGWAVFRGDTPEPTPVAHIPISEPVVAVPEQPLPEPVKEQARDEYVAPEVVVEAEPIAPVVEAEQKPALPSLPTSTPALLNALAERNVNTRPVRSENLIRDFVAFIDNIAAGVVARDSAMIKGPEARFEIEEVDGKAYMGANSYQRYDNIVNWFVGMDNQALVAVFKQYEPLLNEAYAEISRPGDSFLTRFERAVNVLNATPEIAGLIELNTDKIMYTYADEQLESLPAAQRQMLRLGPANMARVKAKLNALQRALNN
ncbi:DUF3014 domain-containing protein [Aliidiomarina quisquiliarum]|uniref:DUF3014 domain-containing protein n=1 Tax=Aliidiomarina quisquiliarum TaxID=2938947 RepID=UPI00208ECA0C|nr:DUF3014 domain-containing protein [Aliidiomarina quisquiliarum]MCO4322683.1 DUF3014 domain-containing protein [Aliidiomarina quisquiliarum]